MRTAWNVFSFLAVVHLLAIAMFIGWLWHTDRLDSARLQDIQAMFAMTVPQAQAAAELAAQEAEAQRQQQEQQFRRDHPDLSSRARLQLIAETQQEADRSMRRLDDVKKQLVQQLAIAAQQADELQAQVDAERRSWLQSIEAERKRRADTQFTKAVKLLEALPPKLAKTKIVELVDSGKISQAVAYLNEMNQRAAGKLLAQFKTDEENRLATELLERLRTFGLDADVPEGSRDANTIASAE
ncbi:MAG: hypothetical protein IH889_01085 [Planctomycetes bacterium]|nr:hypothetical protein [Planctomycetota bacterium]